MNGRYGLLSAALVGALLSVSLPGVAQAASRPYDFGRILLGTEIRRLPNWARGDGHCALPYINFADCYFTDSAGVKYEVFEGSLTQKIVSFSEYRGYAPYGLRPDDNQEKAVRKIEGRLGLQLSCYSHADWNSCSGDVEDDVVGPVIVNVTFYKNDQIREVKITTAEY